MFYTKSKPVIILGIAAFLVMSFWGLYSMPMDEHGKMMNCPFMNGSVNLCRMSIPEHIAQWQLLFTAIRGKSSPFPTLTLLIFFLVALFPIAPNMRDKLLSQRFYHYLYKHNPEMTLFDHLLAAFSQGILNPHIYA